MSPILGIIASQNYSRITSDYESISTITIGSGGQSSITFSSIPSTYTHLQLRIFGADDDSGGSSYGNMTFNGDTGTNYSSHQLYGAGSGANANNFASNNQIYIHRIPGNVTSTFGSVIVDILEYKNTGIYKTVRTFGGYDANGSIVGRMSFASGNWRNTNAITSITLTTGGTKWLEYSHFALYGIKG